MGVAGASAQRRPLALPLASIAAAWQKAGLAFTALDQQRCAHGQVQRRNHHDMGIWVLLSRAIPTCRVVAIVVAPTAL